jgi:hypothetical protein
VPRHIARLVTQLVMPLVVDYSASRRLVVDYFASAARVDAKSALNAKHTASRTKLASHAQRAKDVPVNFS